MGERAESTLTKSVEVLFLCGGFLLPALSMA